MKVKWTEIGRPRVKSLRPRRSFREWRTQGKKTEVRVTLEGTEKEIAVRE